jgi:hypothetical protein
VQGLGGGAVNQLSLDLAHSRGMEASRRCLEAAEARGFDSTGARKFIVSWVRRHGATSGEDLVEAAMAHGFHARDGRAFGGVFKAALNASELRVLRSDLPRKHGHGTSGGRLYGVAA